MGSRWYIRALRGGVKKADGIGDCYNDIYRSPTPIVQLEERSREAIWVDIGFSLECGSRSSDSLALCPRGESSRSSLAIPRRN